MLGSSRLDYWCGRRIAVDHEAGRTGTRFLRLSLVGNLGLLAYFKYANLGVATGNDAAAALGRGDSAFANFQAVALPVGISFYTFQTMSYTIDL